MPNINLQSTAIRQKPNTAVKNNDLIPIVNDLISISEMASTPPGGGTTVGIIGSGTINKIAKFTPNGTSVGDSQIFDDETNVGVGTTTPTAKLDIKSNGNDDTTFGFKLNNVDDDSLFNVKDDGFISNTLINDPSSFFIGNKRDGTDTLKVQADSDGRAFVMTEKTNINGGNAIQFVVSDLGVRSIRGLSNYNAATIADLMIETTGLGINVVADNSAIFQADSTSKGFLPPRMTTVQKNAIVAPIEGLMVYDTTLRKLCVYTTTWETVTSS